MRRLVVPLLLALAVVPAAAAAQLVGDAAVAFSADRSVTWKGKTYPGRVYARPGMQRHEEVFGALSVVAILRADRQTAYVMLPDLNLYTKAPFPKAVTEKGDVSQLGAPVGEATVAGRQAQQYRLARNGSDGSALDGSLWLTRDWIVLKADGTWTAPAHAPEHGTLQLANIVEAPQDPALFEVPAGMQEVPLETVQSLLSLKLPKLKG
ncbi:MAG TPA: hypothetical protein VKS60_18625 [Stellaceae bacterium]|nr:hypothetical protein [Stellaceae bacterium]